MDDDLLVALRVLEQNQRRIEGKLDALIAALAEDEEFETVFTMDGEEHEFRGNTGEPL
mgnify:CR=1 FL=1